MPELNFKITGDDSDIKKTLANVSKIARDNNAQIAKEISKGVDDEVKSRQRAVKTTQDQTKSSRDVVDAVNEEAKAHDRATDAIKRKKGAFDEAGRQIKPVQMSSSLDEVNSSNSGKTGTISSGTVVGTAADFNKAASEATAFGAAADNANKIATEASNKTSQAIKNTIASQDSLNLKLQTQQNVKSAATDPAIVAEYTKRIAETEAAIARLSNVGKRGYDELGNRIKSTIGQQEVLTTRLKYFQDQLQYAKVPQSFVTLNKKIQETEDQLNRLANAGKRGFDDLGNKINVADGAGNKFLSTIKAIGAAILAAFSVQVILSFLKESRELAARGEGIREAFAKLGTDKTLDLLRVATRGATSDIELMSAALRAKNFQIAPELLAKGLELAGKVSRQTGQDVTYLTDSFVNGLGRKSLLILDNLQISQIQLRAEIKKTGDFQTAVGNVVNEKLKSMGEVSMTTADKMAQFATKIANIKELVGQKINLVLNYEGLKEANKEFYETGLSVKSLQDNIAPLLNKYDQLSAKAEKNGGVTKLSKIEQSLLKDTIRQVSSEIPSAITQFDKYGNAIAISTDRARDFIKQQILVMQALNETRINESIKKLGEFNKELTAIQDKTEELTKTGNIMLPTYKGGGTGSGVSSFGDNSAFRKATEKEKAEFVARQQMLIGEIAKTNALLESDSGSLLTKRQKENEAFQKITKTEDSRADEKVNKARERQERADAAALSAQESLQQRIQVMKDKFERSGLSKEQEARRAIIDEFKKLAFDIEQQGKKYDAYAKKYGEARAAAVLGPKQTTEQIEPIRKAAIDDLVYRQDTAKFELQINKQKDIYTAYEEWKRLFGAASANKRFGNELDTSTTYLQKLQDRYSKLIFKSAVGTISGKPSLTGAEEEEMTNGVKLIDDANRQIQAKNDSFYADAYQAALTHSQRIDKINEAYRKKAYDLRDSITDAQKIELNDQRDAAINAANDEALAKTAIYKKLAEETILLTREQVKEQLKALEGLLDAGGLPTDVTEKIQGQVDKLKVSLKIGVDQANLNELKIKLSNVKKQLSDPRDKAGEVIVLSPEQKKRLLNDLGEVQIAIDEIDSNGDGVASWADGVADHFKYLSGSAKEVAEGISRDLGDLSNGFNELSSALGGNDTQAGYLLDTISQLTKAGSDAAGSFASFASGDIIGGVTKAISAVSSVLSIGKKVKEMNAAARKEVEDFYAAAIKGETDYQALLRKRELDSVARGKNSYNAIIAQLEAIKSQSPEIQKAYDKIFDSLQGQQYVDGKGSQHGTWLRKAKTWDIMASLSGSDYDDLENLDAQGKLSGDTKTNFDNLKLLHDELEAAGISAEDLKKELRELLTGTNTSQLADGLKSLFENGTRSAQDFGDSFENIMKNSLLNSFKAKYLDDALQPFYNELADMMASGTPTEAEIAALKEKYIKLGLDADAYLANIEKVTGQNLSKDDDKSPNSLTGAYATASQESISLLAGQTAGMRIAQLETNTLIKSLGMTGIEQLNVAKSHLDVAMQIQVNTYNTANNTNRLENIETQLIQMNRKIGNDGEYLKAGGY